MRSGRIDGAPDYTNVTTGSHKYVILVGDGMADEPRPELDGRTPLQAADTPHMDALAARGQLGLVRTVPRGFPPGSDVANLSIMGYDPARYHTGRAPIEAASQGIELAPDEVAFRCNLVTVEVNGDEVTMVDYAAGHVSTEEAAELIAALDERLGDDGRRFRAGVSYRHLLIWQNGPLAAESLPPHDFTGRSVGRLFIAGQDTARVADLVRGSWEVLPDHPVNRKRRAQAQHPANSIWLWGQGTRPQLPTLAERFGLRGAVVSAVDLVRGLGVLAGLETIEVTGATGWLDTNYAGKVAAALEALSRLDLVMVHVEAPDEAGHSGRLEWKLRAIADFDAKVVGPMVAGLKDRGPYRMLLMCDHPTPLSVRTHTADPVPFAIYDSASPRDTPQGYNETDARRTGLMIEAGHDLLARLVTRTD
ncbi:MAG: cofactor-independent phosphoglycerate mutase [Proteobacteria bacterium]|nr:cofactor-independent phosphoglycerate mutase [Pseudomonadota bacterium]